MEENSSFGILKTSDRVLVLLNAWVMILLTRLKIIQHSDKVEEHSWRFISKSGEVLISKFLQKRAIPDLATARFSWCYFWHGTIEPFSIDQAKNAKTLKMPLMAEILLKMCMEYECSSFFGKVYHTRNFQAKLLIRSRVIK